MSVVSRLTRFGVHAHWCKKAPSPLPAPSKKRPQPLGGEAGAGKFGIAFICPGAARRTSQTCFGLRLQPQLYNPAGFRLMETICQSICPAACLTASELR